MRLAQIARKVQVKPTEIRAFIKKEFKIELDSDPNIKLEENQVTAILAKFKVEKPEPKAKPIKKKVEIVEEVIDDSISTDLADLKELAEAKTPKKTTVKKAVAEKPAAKKASADKPATKKKTVATKDKAEAKPKKAAAVTKKVETPTETPTKKVLNIKYDEDNEAPTTSTDEGKVFEAVEVNPDAELIGASVPKLEGLKVVGKIDLGKDEPEEEPLPTAEAIENEIDQLDGDVDTSNFTDSTEEVIDDKAAIFAELDAAMESTVSVEVKPIPQAKVAEEVQEYIEDEEEYSIYKNDRGFYRFSPEQKKNRQISLSKKNQQARIEREKEKKKRHYQENVASKLPEPKKKSNPKKVQPTKNQEKPKGLWNKFKAWLND